MPPLNTHPESPERRNFLIRLWALLIAETVQAQTNNALTRSVPQKSTIALMKHGELLDLVDEAEALLRKKMPEGTKDEDVRYFAIVPDRKDLDKKDISFYTGKLIPEKDKNGKQIWKKVQISDMNGKVVFPNAQIIRGKWVGARIRLNDEGFIILSIGAPVKTESLPDDERSKYPFTMIASTPPNRAFQTPAMQDEGRNYLRETIRGVFEWPLQEENLESSILLEHSIHTSVDRRLITLFAIVEHMDIWSITDASDEQKLAEEYARVLTNYGLNRNLAYRYGKSSAGARGILQITPDTFDRISWLYEDTDTWDTHQEATLDPEKSIMIGAIKIDDDLSTLQRNTNLTKEKYQSWKESNSADVEIPLALGVLYNEGTASLKKMKDLSRLSWLKLPEETTIYLKKIRYVWRRLHERQSPVIPERPQTRKTEVAKWGPKTVKKYSENELRSTLRWKRSRLNFEKSKAKSTAPRALNFSTTQELINTWWLEKITKTPNYSTSPNIWKEWKATQDERKMLYYLTPTAKHNLWKIAEKYREITWDSLHITSMNRNAAYVKKLRKVNPRATSPSSHEYGTTFDCRKITDRRQSVIFEAYLLNLQQKWYIIVIKESACYHIFSELRIG